MISRGIRSSWTARRSGSGRRHRTTRQQPSFSTRFTFVGTGNDGDDQTRLARFIQENDTKYIDIKAEGETIGPRKVVKIEKLQRPDQARSETRPGSSPH